MAKRRVVLTGLGTVNPLAQSVDEFWRALLAGESGIRPITRFDVAAFPCKIGGEVHASTEILEVMEGAWSS